MISIILDKSFSNSMWGMKLQEELTGELKKKHLDYEIIDDVNHLSPKSRYAFLLGTNHPWASYTIDECIERNARPIFVTPSVYYSSHRELCSQICVNIPESVKRMLDALEITGHHKMSLYGINKLSFTDNVRMESYLAFTNKESRTNIFYNSGNLEKCYQDFYNSKIDVDAVFCANEYAAVSLVRHLKMHEPQRLDSLAIVSHSLHIFPSVLTNHILQIKTPLSEYAKNAILVFEMLEKNPNLSGVIISLTWDISPIYGKYTKRYNFVRNKIKTNPASFPNPDIFYKDREVIDLSNMENLFLNMDDLDKKILNELIHNSSYEKISFKYFLSVGSVKYRVKKMLENCKCSRKQDLVSLLRSYAPDGLLE